MAKQLHIIVQGRVQGVYFRVYTRQEAQKYGLTGWVRNLPNGDVEMKVQGDEKALDKMKQWCWHGSPHSKVNNVIIRDDSAPFDSTITSFEITH